jgi:dTDP-4-amino-4,6-dideoxygalactose transaminase
VHLYGLPADMTRLSAIADAAGLVIVEDAAQAIGAKWAGQMVGSWGDAAAFSFYPTKNLGAAGDGGMVVTCDQYLADRVNLLRRQGNREKYHAEELGVNSRLDELQAAILRVKLRYLDSWTARRRERATWYAAGLSGLPVVCPTEPEGAKHVYHQYTIRVPDGLRGAMLAYLIERGIGSTIYYPEPIHRQKLYRGEYAGLSLPEAERAAREVLSLPIYPELARGQVEAVCAAIRALYGEE